MSTSPAQRRAFSVDDYYRMATSGILTEDDRVELIEGEVLDMSPIGSRHAACVNRLNQILVQFFSGNATVAVQNPVRLSDFSEPEPDVAVVKPKGDFYASGHPTPDDVLWLIEVADTSIDFDRQIKLPLYARHGIREVWIVDLAAETVEVHQEPGAEGYRVSQTWLRGQTFNLPGQSGTLEVDQLLGPPA